MEDKLNIYTLLNAIDKFSSLLKKGDYFPLAFLNQKSDIFRQKNNDEIELILNELELAGILIIERPSKLLQVGRGLFYKKYFDYRYKRGPNFDAYYSDLKNDLNIDSDININIDLDKPEYEVSYYDFSRNLTVKQLSSGKSISLTRPQDGSENQVIFKILYDNPGHKFSIDELKKEYHKITSNSIIKDLHKIVKELGFKQELKKSFFNVSMKAILFKKTVTTKDLLSSNIDLSHYFK